MITHQQYKQNVKKHLRNSTSKYQQNCQTQNRCFSQKSHSLVPRQRSFNIDSPGLSRYYYYASTVQTKCQKTFAKLDLQISAELPNTKPLFFAKITFLREHSLVPRQRNFRFDSSIGVRTGGGGVSGVKPLPH